MRALRASKSKKNFHGTSVRCQRNEFHVERWLLHPPPQAGPRHFPRKPCLNICGPFLFSKHEKCQWNEREDFNLQNLIWSACDPIPNASRAPQRVHRQLVLNSFRALLFSPKTTKYQRRACEDFNARNFVWNAVASIPNAGLAPNPSLGNARSSRSSSSSPVLRERCVDPHLPGQPLGGPREQRVVSAQDIKSRFWQNPYSSP